MKIILLEDFKEDYQRIEKRLKDPRSFRKALNKTVSMLQSGKDISKTFPVNRLVARGEGWFSCYVYSDIVMVYKIQGQYIKLTAIGPVKDMFNRE